MQTIVEQAHIEAIDFSKLKDVIFKNKRDADFFQAITEKLYHDAIDRNDENR